MSDQILIGVDLGATNVRAGLIQGAEITNLSKLRISSDGPQEKVLEEVKSVIEDVFVPGVKGIGVGVPSLVDTDKGIVFDVQNIPSWREVHLGEVLNEQFKVPVYVNNDANCFAVGEKHFGKGKDYKDFIGLIVGTGMAAGIIINNKLYSGANCGAGEFGMVQKDTHIHEVYCSGQFFEKFHHTTGEEVYNKAIEGDQGALDLYNQFGQNIGDALKMIMYTIDPEVVILGGSGGRSYHLYEQALKERISDFAFSRSLDKLQIMISDEPHIAVLGAGALYLNEQSQ